jgi:hypothetical protein
MRLQRRGLSALLWAVAGFAGLNLMVCALADYIEPGVREPEYGHKLALLKCQIQQAPDRPLLLFLGSSRTAYGLRSDALFSSQRAEETPLVYNFGILGGGPVYELVYFRRLLNEGIRPRWVVVEVHPALLNAAPELKAAHVPPFDRCDARDLYALNNYLDEPLATWKEWLQYRSTAPYALRGELMRHYAESWNPAPTSIDFMRLDLTTPLGWVPLSWPRPDEAMRKKRAEMCRQAYAPGYCNFEVSDRSNRALREILAICHQENIAGALLLMPEADEVRDGDVILAQERLGQYLRQLSLEYHVPLIDASHWCDDADFGDGQHLLAETATRLSSRLGSEGLADWFASSSPDRGDAVDSTMIATRPQDGVKR